MVAKRRESASFCSGEASAPAARISPMSAPAQNTLPAPVSATMRTVRSPASSASTSVSRVTSSPDSALRVWPVERQGGETAGVACDREHRHHIRNTP